MNKLTFVSQSMLFAIQMRQPAFKIQWNYYIFFQFLFSLLIKSVPRCVAEELLDKVKNNLDVLFVL